MWELVLLPDDLEGLVRYNILVGQDGLLGRQSELMARCIHPLGLALVGPKGVLKPWSVRLLIVRVAVLMGDLLEHLDRPSTLLQGFKQSRLSLSGSSYREYLSRVLK